MPKRKRSSDGEGAAGEESAAAVLQVAQGLERRLQEAVSRMERQLQEKDAAIRALQQRLDALQTAKSTEGPGGEGALARLVGRVDQVEDSLQNALVTFFPRVDALLLQLEKNPPAGASWADSSLCNSYPHSPASAFASTSASSVGRAAAAGGGREEPAAGRQGAAEEEEEQRQKDLVRLRVQEAVEKANMSRACPCPLGEALCMAAAVGGLEEVRRLLDSGANANYANEHGSYPLIRALCGNRESDAAAPVVSLLLERGADPNAVNLYGSTALHFAAEGDPSGRCVELLVGAGADANVRNINGSTPLHLAAQEDNEAAARRLLEAGARRDLRCWGVWYRNMAPFDLAASPAVRDLLTVGL